MAKKMNDCKILSLKSSKGVISCNVYTLKIPNFFTQPEYGSSAEVSSPAFEFANATWCFHFRSRERKDGIKNLTVFMKRMNSEIPCHLIIYKITLLDANDKTYEDWCNANNVLQNTDDKSFFMWMFTNESPSYDRRDTLTLIIHLICHGLREHDTYEAPTVKNTDDKMAEEKKECKISLKLSRKSISSDVYTLKVSNLFTVQEHDGTVVKIKSPPFEFADETWCFQFHSINPRKEFDVHILRLNSKKNNLNKNLNGKEFFYFMAVIDKNEKEYKDLSGVCSFKEDRKKCNLCSLFYDSSYTLDTVTLIFHLFPCELLDVDAVNMPCTMSRNLDLLSRDFKKLFLNGEKQDLILKVADKEFRVHQNILMARSEVFEAMLTHDMIEKNKGVIDVPDCDPQAMEQFLYYVYSGKVETLNQNNVLGLYYAADKYDMTLLKEMCSEYIKESLSPSIIGDVIQLALNHNDTDLLEYAKEYFVNPTSDILPTVEWMSFMKSNFIVANELFLKASKKWDHAKS